MIPTDETSFIASLRQVFTKIRHGISARSTSIYAPGKSWITDRRPKETIRHAVQRGVTYLRATPWQALAIQYRPLLLGLGVLLLLLIIWKVPQWQAARWEGRIEPKELAKQESDTRTTVVQAIGGAAVLIGLYFSAKTLRTTQEGQITDRFTKAINQLGEAGPDKLAIRLGGIYALERIARDSPRDHWPIIEVLTAYVREHAPWPPKAIQRLTDDLSLLAEEEQPKPNPTADILAILTVLGRIQVFGEKKPWRLDLSSTDLRQIGLSLVDAHLERANLGNTHLEGAALREVHLEGAFLVDAHLERAFLWLAHLERAVLMDAHLEEATLIDAHLEGADLRGAHLERARLEDAHLEGANLQGAYLENATGLTVEQLATVRTLYQARLDPPLMEELTRKYPHLLKAP